MEQERKRYLFRYNDILIADWYATEEQMMFHAQGMVMGLRVFRAHPEVAVYEVQEDDSEKLVRIQR